MGRWPMGQPPGREVSARPSRASSGAQKRMEARIRAAASPGRVLHTGVPLTTTSAPCRRASHPAPRSSARQHSTSDRAGTARSRTVPRQSSAAARSGSTLFFAAGTAAVPFSGLPPITQIRPLSCVISPAPRSRKDTPQYAETEKYVCSFGKRLSLLGSWRKAPFSVSFRRKICYTCSAASSAHYQMGGR